MVWDTRGYFEKIGLGCCRPWCVGVLFLKFFMCDLSHLQYCWLHVCRWDATIVSSGGKSVLWVHTFAPALALRGVQVVMTQWQPTSLSVNPSHVFSSRFGFIIYICFEWFTCQIEIIIVMVYQVILIEELVIAARLAFDLGQPIARTVWVTTLAFDGWRSILWEINRKVQSSEHVLRSCAKDHI